MSLWQVPLSIQRSEGVQLAVPILSDTNDKVALHQSGTALLDPGSVGGRRRRSTAVCVELLTGRVRARMPGIEANIGARREPTDSLPYSTMGWTSATRRGGHLTACLPFLPFLPWLAENARCTRRPLCVALCRSHSCPKAGGIQATFECERRCHRSAMQAVAGSPCNADETNMTTWLANTKCCTFGEARARQRKLFFRLAYDQDLFFWRDTTHSPRNVPALHTFCTNDESSGTNVGE